LHPRLADLLGYLVLSDRGVHALQQVGVVLVALGLLVEIGGTLVSRSSPISFTYFCMKRS